MLVWIVGFGFNYEGVLFYVRINFRYVKRKERLFKYDVNMCGKLYIILMCFIFYMKWWGSLEEVIIIGMCFKWFLNEGGDNCKDEVF